MKAKLNFTDVIPNSSNPQLVAGEIVWDPIYALSEDLISISITRLAAFGFSFDPTQEAGRIRFRYNFSNADHLRECIAVSFPWLEFE